MSLFDTMKQSGVQIPTTEAERNELVVTEGSTGYWYYHLSRRVNLMRALCSAPTLPTAIPLSAWGAPAEEGLPKSPTYCQAWEEGLPKSPTYCQACARIAWPQPESAGDASSPGPGQTA